MTLQEKIQKKAEGFGKLAPVFLEGAKFALENMIEGMIPCKDISDKGHLGSLEERWSQIDKIAAEQSSYRLLRYKEAAVNVSDLEVRKFFSNPYIMALIENGMACCLDYGAKWADANPYIEWLNFKEKEPPFGEEVLAFNRKWIDEDFNPKGIRVGFLSDDGFISAFWYDEQDCYETISKQHCEDDEDFYANHIDNTEPEFWTYFPEFVNPLNNKI